MTGSAGELLFAFAKKPTVHRFGHEDHLACCSFVIFCVSSIILPLVTVFALDAKSATPCLHFPFDPSGRPGLGQNDQIGRGVVRGCIRWLGSGSGGVDKRWSGIDRAGGGVGSLMNG